MVSRAKENRASNRAAPASYAFYLPCPICGLGQVALAWPGPGLGRVLLHRQQPRTVTWRSCVLCSRSRPGRWCPRCPPGRRSASSSCDASSRLLQSPTLPGHRGETARIQPAGYFLLPQRSCSLSPATRRPRGMAQPLPFAGSAPAPKVPHRRRPEAVTAQRSAASGTAPQLFGFPHRHAASWQDAGTHGRQMLRAGPS